MTKDAWFWIVLVIWVLFGFYSNRPKDGPWNFGWLGDRLVLIVLLGLLGWHCFGSVAR